MSDREDAFRLVQQRFAEAQSAFRALEGAHRRGEFEGLEHNSFLNRIDAVRRAVAAFHLEVERERAERLR